MKIRSPRTLTWGTLAAAIGSAVLLAAASCGLPAVDGHAGGAARDTSLLSSILAGFAGQGAGYDPAPPRPAASR